MEINIYKFIWDSAKGRKFFLFLFFFVMILNNLVSLFLAQYLYKNIINSIIENNLEFKNGIFYISLLCFLLTFGTFGLLLKNTFKFNSINFIQRNIRNKLFSYTIQHSVNYFNNSFSGSLSGKIRNTTLTTRFFFTYLFSILNLFIFFIALLIVYSHINIFLGLFFAFITFLYLIVVFKLRKNLISSSVQNSESKSKYFGIINDDFANIVNVKSFNREKNEINRVKRQNLDILRKTSKVLRNHAYIGISNSIFAFCFIISTMGFSVYLLVSNKIGLGNFLFISSITEIFRRFLFDGIYAVSKAFEAIGDFKNTLDTIMKPIEIKDRTNAVKISNVEGKIVFKNVNFGYKTEYDK